MKPLPNFEIENSLEGLVAGVDEVGRGPCAGPLVVCALILHPKFIPLGLNDSKALSHKTRLRLANEIKSSCINYQIIVKPPAFIDEYNIFKATMMAMIEAADQLRPMPDHVLFDGPHAPQSPNFQSHSLIRGDQKSLSIAAASIVAKTHRDAIMIDLDVMNPEYGFAKHKGYQSQLHIEALRQYGPSIHHRQSWATVKNAINIQNSKEV